jgi:hypothetical protein
MATVSDVLTMLIPTGGWVVVGNEWDGVQFIEATPITKAQFDKGVADYDAWKTAQDAQITADKSSATAKLEALGLTANDLKALGL